MIDADEEEVHNEKLAVCVEEESDAIDFPHPTESAESAEPVVFEEPIDLAEYDEFTLDKVVIRRLASNVEEITRVTAPKEVSVLPSIEALSSLIGFEEDEEDIRQAEQSKARTDELGAPAAPSGAASEGVAKALPRAPQQSWADTTLIPPEEFETLRPSMTLSYPFELDTFQKQAVMRLERHEHVFVAAHTSAGKTVVAEYAIALALKRGSRAVYTSPIKALSNQKYRDFKERFGVDNVGIVTGDVSVNPQAQCLIMTTEIFRSMLYKGADTVRDIEYVIFDEVHYVNDAERGVVWEEVIIMLPESICLVFLSATTPNAIDFSDWIGRTKRRKVFLISTNKRPVPLQHYLFFEDEAFKLMQGDSQYNPGAMAAAAKVLKEKSMPKQQSAENAKFSQQRQQEKAAIAAQKAGKDSQKAAQIKAQALQAGNRKPASKGPGAGYGNNKATGGGRSQWLSLLNILQAGGREQSGGLGGIEFGVATNNRTVLLSRLARQEKNDMIPYEKLPNYIRSSLSRKEYEGIEVRASEEDPESAGGELGLLPVVIFSFSKKKCEELADFFKSQDLLTNRERRKVAGIVHSVLERLSPVDAQLPQIHRLQEMLSRGIGVHHSGLLPILKETVEILFAAGIVKVLLATETFAMGVNMPARSVVFNGYRKHDGRQFRDLFPGEYIQMAGRAGRRGLDKVGTVIIANWGDLPSEINIRKLLTGKPTLLSSKFRLRYSMILNLIRTDALSIEDMMKRSFTEFSAQKALASHDLLFKRKKYELLTDYLRGLLERHDPELNEEVTQYVRCFRTCQELLWDELLLIDKVLANNRCASSIDHMLCTGRALQIHTHKTGKPVYAVVLASPSACARMKKALAPPTAKAKPKEESSIAAARAALLGGSQGSSRLGGDSDVKVSAESAKVHVLALLDNDDLPDWCMAEASPQQLQFAPLNDLPTLFGYASVDGEADDSAYRPFLLLEVSPRDIGIIYDSTLSVPVENDQVNLGGLVTAITKLAAKKRSSGGGADAPLNLMRVQKSAAATDMEIADLQHRWIHHSNFVINEFLPRVYPQLSLQYSNVHKLEKVSKKLEIIRHAISTASISLFPEFRQRRNVLQQLGYIQAVDQSAFAPSFEAQQQHEFVITKKGRVCCELNSCDELLGTEMLFHNILEPLNPPEIAGILSALVFQEKNDVDEVLTSRMEVARQALTEIFHKLNTLQQLEKIEVDPEVSGTKPILNFGLCSVVYQWARGIALKEIMGITTFQEGSIVRAITRLDELCRDIQKAAQTMGNESLYYKMEAVSQCIRRDIVFAASLYIA